MEARWTSFDVHLVQPCNHTFIRCCQNNIAQVDEDSNVFPNIMNLANSIFRMKMVGN